MKKRVGILRGGAGVNYATSVARGGDLMSHIYEHLSEKYYPLDILVDKNHIWHFQGVPISPGDLVHRVDVVWNTAHPSMTSVLESLSIPTISAPHFSSMMLNGRELLREHMRKVGVDIPRAIVLPVYQEDFDGPREKYAINKAKKVFEKFSAPWLVRSFSPDAHMGIHVAKTFPELVYAIEDGLNHGKSILVEEFISDRLATVHTLPNFRGEKIYTLPVGSDFGMFSKEERKKLTELAKEIYDHIGAKHYLKTDFAFSPRGQVYLLDLDSVPEVYPESHFAQSCGDIGAKAHHILKHLLEQAVS